MAGIYIHIPFCKQACHYCNFHFATSLRYKDQMLEAIIKELLLRKEFFGAGKNIETVYFGGGTPSLLSADDINRLFEIIFKNFKIDALQEVTFEANPDDLTPIYLKSLTSTPVSRLSIGLQSFHEEDLKWMNRAHHAAQSKACLADALDLGFQDLSVDLIYGSPTTTNEMWYENLTEVLNYGIEHISAYCLTVEEKTLLNKMIKTGKSVPVDNNKGATQFLMLIEYLAAQGFEQYEISNFAQNKRYAKHNTSYWQGEPYLGIGPSAHSYRGSERSWNIANNQQYIQRIDKNELPLEFEILSNEDLFNEAIMTGLRTIWGVSADTLKSIDNQFFIEFEKSVQEFINSGKVIIQEGSYALTRSGKLMADRIASDLFITTP